MHHIFRNVDGWQISNIGHTSGEAKESIVNAKGNIFMKESHSAENSEADRSPQLLKQCGNSGMSIY